MHFPPGKRHRSRNYRRSRSTANEHLWSRKPKKPRKEPRIFRPRPCPRFWSTRQTIPAIEEVVPPYLEKRVNLFLPREVRTRDRIPAKRTLNSYRRSSRRVTPLSSKRPKFPGMESWSEAKTTVDPGSRHLRRQRTFHSVNFMNRTTSNKRFYHLPRNSFPSIDIPVRRYTTLLYPINFSNFKFFVSSFPLIADFILVSATNASAHQSLKRRSSVKSNGMAHSHHELFQTRRTSVPVNCISYISTENVSKSEATEFSLNSGLDKSYIIGECGHRRALFSGTGYRCEKHGGRGHRAILNGSAETPPPPRRHKKHYDSQNASSPSVPAMVNASYSDTGKC